MLLSIIPVKIENEETGEDTMGWRLANADGHGYGDVFSAVIMVGLPGGNKRHPAVRVYDTKDEAIAAAEFLGRELAEKFGGAFEIVK